MDNQTCIVPDCKNGVNSRGNCATHYSKLRDLVNRSKGSDEPVTWDLLVDAGLASPKRSGLQTSEFITDVLATLAERRKSKESTSS